MAPRGRPQQTAISIKGLTPGVAYHLAQCCHPIPGDRIVGLRREDEEIEVHVIGCDTLASGVDADWLDLAWGEGSDGGAARLAVILRDIPGALGTMSGILGQKHANIINLQLVHRDCAINREATRARATAGPRRRASRRPGGRVG